MVNLKDMISADVIEKYQTILRHNPASQVFAPLADAYLERGLTLQAEELAKTGTERHPLFPAGFLILGKIYLKTNKLDEAEVALQKCIELSPQNILAHQFLGDVYISQKKPLDALRAFKMTLFLNPYSAKAKKAVEKLETASALEFEEDTFAMAKLSDIKKIQKNQAEDVNHEKSIKPILQLVDAFLVRGDRDQAADLLYEAKSEFGNHPELEVRLKKISGQTSIARMQAKSKGVEQPPQKAVASSTKSPSDILRLQRENKLHRLYEMLRSVRLAKLVSQRV
jgi:tetratricopeptide (TPR) repeat protein